MLQLFIKWALNKLFLISFNCKFNILLLVGIFLLMFCIKFVDMNMTGFLNSFLFVKIFNISHGYNIKIIMIIFIIFVLKKK